jgi:membrane protein
MPVTTNPPPIPGEVIDPPPKEAPRKVKQIDAQDGAVSTAVGVGFRAFTRFSQSQASLLAAGTAFFLFLAMFSIIALVYGVVTSLGAEQVASYLTEAIGSAFPGLLGENGIDPDDLRRVGQATSLVGLVGLLYAGTNAVMAAIRSIHRIYGAPQDSRNFFHARLRAVLWLAVLGVLILLSFVMSSFTSDLTDRALDALDVAWQGPSALVTVTTVVLTLLVNFLVVYLVLGNFGGIRPARAARVVGAGSGAVVIEVLKTLMTLIVDVTIERPQFGAVAAPIGVLFVLYLLSTALYAAAALTGGVADRQTPLEVLQESDVEQSQAAVTHAARQLGATRDVGVTREQRDATSRDRGSD